MNIEIEEVVRLAAPGLKVVTIEADVKNHPTTPQLRQEIQELASKVKSKHQLPEINKRPAIAGTRRAYKALGKEPNRYRPSCEALCRRIVKGMDLYFISDLVDITNLVSIASGYSIGGFDGDKIDGNTLWLGVGHEGEEYAGIGRGELNIANMPVYRDNIGGIGTPTSDHERTKLDLSTKRLLMCINIYEEEMPADETVALAERLLRQYCDASDIKVTIYE
ncbi:MAG: phenylalanine--tRNA ligase beta subunit-related protein [Muribaculum sp.]|nr:phenylalanine--tRNA ligase beta subunit-related protein [Muribaculum sp.]